MTKQPQSEYPYNALTGRLFNDKGKDDVSYTLEAFASYSPPEEAIEMSIRE